jgi:hypothetical protein
MMTGGAMLSLFCTCLVWHIANRACALPGLWKFQKLCLNHSGKEDIDIGTFS